MVFQRKSLFASVTVGAINSNPWIRCQLLRLPAVPRALPRGSALLAWGKSELQMSKLVARLSTLASRALSRDRCSCKLCGDSVVRFDRCGLKADDTAGAALWLWKARVESRSVLVRRPCRQHACMCLHASTGHDFFSSANTNMVEMTMLRHQAPGSASASMISVS